MRWSAGICLVLLVGPRAVPARAVDYVRDVKPILRAHCYDCHGALRQNGGLRLDHISFIRQGGERGSVIDGGGSGSLLIRAVSAGDDGSRDGIDRMPRDAKPLSVEQIATLTQWIDAGATAPDEPLPADPRLHWSFQKPVRVPLPVVKNPAWSTHPIDRFLAAEHERQGLVPTEPASKNILLRRVYLDLIGLPPSPIELRSFLQDRSPDAYERVVDRLLVSSRYGERWGRHWMDVWRYSDWDGFGRDLIVESQPHIWRWRDWIIESLNRDKPYDQMVREMLAADETAPLDADAARASGFLARNWHRTNRNVWMDATVEHTAKAFLGLTFNCARCHDHKYDPISHKEYYQLRAFFEPYDVRNDRVPGEANINRDALLRIYDAFAEKPTYLFERGNENHPDQSNPLAPAVPRALGGDELAVSSIALPRPAYYPGSQPGVQREMLAHARSDIDRIELAMADADRALASARQRLLDRTAAESTQSAAQAASSQQSVQTASKSEANSDEAALREAVREGERVSATLEQEMLAARANLVAVRAQIAADEAAFATPPADNARALAREARRAQRVFNVVHTRHELMRLQHELEVAKAHSETDDAAKKRFLELGFSVIEMFKAHTAATTELGQASANYTMFGRDSRCATTAPGANDEPGTQLSPIYPTTSTGRRAALAHWIASNNNPLTARVAINHIWLRHFGGPLVPTVFDFGRNGKLPSNPALLDWLAVELMDGGWKMKNIHRLIVTSSAYRMKSTSTNKLNQKRDPENVALWRMNPRRMEAEAIRDSTLSVADALDLTTSGPELDESLGLTVPRRSIYFRHSKEKQMRFLEIFDSPNVSECYRRNETVVPQQALAMANSALTLAQARRLAGILQKQVSTPTAPPAPSAFITAAFERVLCRQPTRQEVAACVQFLDLQRRDLADARSRVPFSSGDANPVPPSSDPAQRAREDLVHVLLNHNDFLTIR